MAPHARGRAHPAARAGAGRPRGRARHAGAAPREAARARRRIPGIYRRLLAAYGPRHWWPARTAFEVVVGAVLTQNTAWSNVEHAIRSLRAAGALSPGAMRDLADPDLMALIRPAGYFRQKTRTLRAVLDHLDAGGGLRRLARQPEADLRAGLLGVRGIGPETADSILLYALDRPVFVVDAYTRRIGGRLGILRGGEGYEEIRALFESALPREAAHLNELHALLVEHAKRRCRKAPLCEGCPLRRGCGRAPATSSRAPGPSREGRSPRRGGAAGSPPSSRR